MSRAQRLLDLLQHLRNHRFPITAEHLAWELRVSTRTLYRDIATLQQQGADIVGEPGLHRAALSTCTHAADQSVAGTP